MTQANKAFNHHLYHRVTSHINHTQCALISQYFHTALENNSKQLKKTHLFHGRYENIYLKDTTFEPLNDLVSSLIQLAAPLLNCKKNELSIDYWFNHMPPNHITDWHRHDVMDEQLSAVFYLKVPENSGDLLLKKADSIKRIQPKENDCVFFNPNIEHSVETNKSPLSRLSIGMNFGFLADKPQ